MRKQYKTGKAQRDAVKAYRERTPQKNFCVTVSAEQYEKDKALLTAHGFTKKNGRDLATGNFWRWAIERLNAEPLPNPDNSKENENPD